MNGAYRVVLLDTKGSNPNHYICLALRDALRKLDSVELVVKVGLHNAVSEAINNNCNVFIAFDGEELNREICARLSTICERSVLWVTEDPYELSVNVKNADIFDLVFTNDSACVAAYGVKGRHLPLAGSTAFHLLPVKNELRDIRYDMFFAGTAWPNRVSLLREVIGQTSHVESFKAKIALPTNEHLPAVDLPLAQSEINWRTSPKDFARFSNMSLSTLVLPRVFSASSNRDFAETPPPRLFETALSGTVQLVQSKLKEAEEYFIPGDDFLFFDDAKELSEILKSLRNDYEWRNRIALSAQTRALEHHCYEQRATAILSELSKLDDNSMRIATQTSRKPRLMYVVHNVVEYGNFGGVEVYLKHISQEMADEFDIYFYVPAKHSTSPEIKVLDAKGNALFVHTFEQPLSPWQLSCPERESVFAAAISQFNIDIVHFHHLIKHVPSLIEIARSLGCSTAMTMHDYYAVCHNFTLTSFRRSYCSPDKISLSQCDVCLWNMHHALPGSQAARRAYWDLVLSELDVLVFNTKGAVDLMSSIYPAVLTHKKLEILPVPILPIDKRCRTRDVDNTALKVAIIGNFAPHKGADVMARVIPLMQHANIEFHIFGRIDGAYAWLMNNKSLPFVYVYGSHSPGKLPEEVYDCDVSLHLSIWPETYCLTLSEAWECGLVPIVADIGALGERVTDGVNGLKIEPDSEGAVVQALRRISETPGLLDKLRCGATDAPIARSEGHVKNLISIYRSMLGNKKIADIKHGSNVRINHEMLKRPIEMYWAIVPQTSDDKYILPYRPGFRTRIKGLIKRGLLHFQENGAVSTVKVGARYIARRF